MATEPSELDYLKKLINRTNKKSWTTRNSTTYIIEKKSKPQKILKIKEELESIKHELKRSSDSFKNKIEKRLF